MCVRRSVHSNFFRNGCLKIREFTVLEGFGVPAEGRTFLRTLRAQRASVRSFVRPSVHQKGPVFKMDLV